MKFQASRIPLLLIVLITLIFVKLQANKHSGSASDVCMNICSDGRGYYAWLPAIFIYHDLNCGFFENEELKSPVCGGPVGGCIQDYRNSFNGKICNKYYPGTSFLMLPFFIIGDIATRLCTQYPPNGYVPPYFLLIGWAGIFYYFLGMFVFLKILDKLKLGTLQKSLTVILVTFGTNIMYFSVDKPAYSHIYSFFLIAAFLYYALCLKEKASVKYVGYISFVLSFIFITRPVNISIALILPFILSGSLRSLAENFLKRPINFLLLLPGLIMPMVLFTLYKIATGHFFIYSYDKEGFDFLHPHFWQFLFHYDNGVFSYMPLLIMPFLFLFVWYQKASKNLIIGSFITLLVTMYIHSSWWCWSYGFSFGARTVLDFVPLFGMIIGLSLKEASRRGSFVLIPVYTLCVVFTMLLYNQKNHGFLNQYPITDYWAAIRNAIGLR